MFYFLHSVRWPYNVCDSSNNKPSRNLCGHKIIELCYHKSRHSYWAKTIAVLAPLCIVTLHPQVAFRYYYLVSFIGSSPEQSQKNT